METGRRYSQLDMNEIIEMVYRDGALEIYHHGRNSWTREKLVQHISAGHTKTRVSYCIPMSAAREANELSNEIDEIFNTRK